MINPVQHDLTYLEQLAVLADSYDAVASAADAVVRQSGEQVSVRVLSRRRGRVDYFGVEYVTVRKGAKLDRNATLEDARPHLLTLDACLAEGLASPETIARYEAAVADRDVAVAACRESEAVYAAAPWARYWLVTTSDGHIHSSTGCCTCHKGKSRTGFALVPYLSGRPVEDAVADLGPALCTACYPSAPVESREQARISSRLSLCLAEEGCEAFRKAREEASAKAAARCPGTGQRGLQSPHRGSVKCPCCGDVSRPLSNGKVRPHRPARYVVENGDYKAWNGTGWGPGTRAQSYDTAAAAEAVAAAVGGKIRRK
jgi:hypothetical protein